MLWAELSLILVTACAVLDVGTDNAYNKRWETLK